MKIKYFEDTDTLYIEFRQAEVFETKNLDENTIMDLDVKATFARSPLNMHASLQRSPYSPMSKYRHEQHSCAAADSRIGSLQLQPHRPDEIP
jgi:hypothetical protein